MNRRGFLAALSGSVLLAGCSDGGSEDFTVAGARVGRGTVPGHLWGGKDAPWLIAVPNAPARGLVVCLHGKDGRAESAYEMGFPEHAVAAGLAFVSVTGGNGYWHKRADGSDAGALVVEQLIPSALGAAALDLNAPVGFIGWSMGGYGSLLLAKERSPHQLLGVATMSAALWTQPGASAPGAFDSADDYRAHDVFAARRLLPGARISMACGLSDPFIASNKAYLAARPQTTHLWDAGGHTGEYWSGHAKALIDFLAASPLAA